MGFFKNIAVASAFSPRFLPLLAEAGRITQGFGSRLSVVHAGAESNENKARFAEAMTQLNFFPKPPIIWANGEPAEAIRRTVAECGFDLLIAGALEKESAGRHYVGEVTRSLMLGAACSLWLLVNPSVEGQSPREIVSIVDFSPVSALGLQCTYFLAGLHKAECVHLLRIFTIFSQALGQPREFFEKQHAHHAMIEAEEKRTRDFAAKVGPCPVPLEAKCIEGTTGFAASEYAEALKADLFVLPSEHPGTPQLFPSGTDWITKAIPSDLLIVRQQGKHPAG